MMRTSCSSPKSPVAVSASRRMIKKVSIDLTARENKNFFFFLRQKPAASSTAFTDRRRTKPQKRKTLTYVRARDFA